MITKDIVINSLQNLKKPENVILLAGAKMILDNTAFGAPKPTNVAKDDPFSLSAFTAQLQSNQFRLTKGFHYVVYMMFPDVVEPSEFMLFGFHCNKVNLPGWRADTQKGKIYGIEYEIAKSLEQDPVWMTFNIDIYHKIETYFMSTKKVNTFDSESFSPKYKHDYQFQMIIYVTDENFTPLNGYILNNAMVKTVQNIQYGAGNEQHQEVSVEVVYESIDVQLNLNSRTPKEPNKKTKAEEWLASHLHGNQLTIGPFSADVSLVNQVKDTFMKVPDWFKGPKQI